MYLNMTKDIENEVATVNTERTELEEAMPTSKAILRPLPSSEEESKLSIY